MDLESIENSIYDEGIELFCGVDEAGRGPLAGPGFAAAVILPRDLKIPYLNDSKKLTEKRREELYGIIISGAVAYGIASADEAEIEELNILNATYLAMNRAIEKLSVTPLLALIDGNRNSGINIQSRTIVGGDGRCASIAAASILAKVSRDRYMVEISKRYPDYGFEKHKGYGTKEHYERLKEFGISAIHRKAFLKKQRGEVMGL